MYAVRSAKLLIELFRLYACHRVGLVNRRDVPIHRLNLVFTLLNRKAEEIVFIRKRSELFKCDLRIRTRGRLNIALHIEIEP